MVNTMPSVTIRRYRACHSPSRVVNNDTPVTDRHLLSTHLLYHNHVSYATACRLRGEPSYLVRDEESAYLDLQAGDEDANNPRPETPLW